MAAICLLVSGALLLVTGANGRGSAVAAIAAALLPLVGAVVVRLGSGPAATRRGVGLRARADILGSGSWLRTRLLALEVRLENARLARVLGLAPSSCAAPNRGRRRYRCAGARRREKRESLTGRRCPWISTDRGDCGRGPGPAGQGGGWARGTRPRGWVASLPSSHERPARLVSRPGRCAGPVAGSGTVRAGVRRPPTDQMQWDPRRSPTYPLRRPHHRPARVPGRPTTRVAWAHHRVAGGVGGWLPEPC